MSPLIPIGQAFGMHLATVLVDAVVKGCIVLAAAGGLALLLRRSSAALRHLTWGVAICSLLCLPILSAVLPRWQVWVAPEAIRPILAPSMAGEQPAAPQVLPVTLQSTAAQPHASPSADADASETAIAPAVSPLPAQPLPAAAPAPALHWTTWLLLAWLVGLIVLTVPLLVGDTAIRRTMRQAQPVGGDILALLEDLRRQLRIGRAVRLLQGGPWQIPLTWGLLRPVVLLPSEAASWPLQRLRLVLLHELAHVQRGDWLLQRIGAIARAVYWFNPLVWLAVRAMRREAEQACDDRVLAAGFGAVEYASQLLEIVRNLRLVRPASAAAVAMARPSTLEGRIRAIIDPRRRRGVLTRASLLAAVLLAIVLVIPLATLRAGGATSASGAPSAGAAIPAGAPTTASAAAAAPAAVPVPAAVLDFHLVDGRTNQPLPERPADDLHQQRQADGPDGCQGQLPAAAAGPSAAVPLYYRPGIRPRADGGHLRQPAADPADYTLVLPPALPIGGVIQDEQGNGIPGVSVSVSIAKTMPSRLERVEIHDAKVVTDASGRWQYDSAPKDPDKVYVARKHPDYIGDDYVQSMAPVMVMRKGVAVTGRVVDDAGNPIEGVEVIQGRDRWGTSFPSTRTDAQGQFRFGQVKPGEELILTAQKPGYTPDLQRLPTGPDAVPVEFHLGPGRTILARVVDAAGKPVPDVRVDADTWRQCRTLDWSTRTDHEGRFRWDGAPADEVGFHMMKQGYMTLWRHPLVAGEQEQVVTLGSALRVSGTVTDAATGEPVRQFAARPGFAVDAVSSQPAGRRGSLPTEPTMWYDDRDKPGIDGRYEIQCEAGYPFYFIRIDGQGYEPAVSRAMRNNEGEVTLDFALHKGQWLTGTVLDPQGKPVEGASVIIGTPTHPLRTINGFVENSRDCPTLTTKQDGKYSFPPVRGVYEVVVIHASGFAQVTASQQARSPDITLQPWGWVEGTVNRQGKPQSEEVVRMYLREPTPASNWLSNLLGGPDRKPVYHSWETRTDPQGRFVFGRVVPGTLRIATDKVQPGGRGAVAPGWQAQLNVPPGQRLVVPLGGTDGDSKPWAPCFTAHAARISSVSVGTRGQRWATTGTMI